MYAERDAEKCMYEKAVSAYREDCSTNNVAFRCHGRLLHIQLLVVGATDGNQTTRGICCVQCT